jgi:PmbA/TldA metallopeptidase C-terminal domain
MNRVVKRIACTIWLLSAVAVACPLRASDDVAMKAMRDEMARSLDMQLPGLAKPYFLAYRIEDIHSISIVASLGSLVTSQDIRSRLLRAEVRVGDYKLDNTNFISFSNREAGGFATARQIPIDDDYNEIRRQLWLATDSEYKKAVRVLAAKQAALGNQSNGQDIPDFSRESANKHFEKQPADSVNVAALQAAARQISAVFREMPEPESSQVTIAVQTVYTRYLNSEGTEFSQPGSMTFLEMNATTQAADGLPLDDREQMLLNSPSGLSAEALAVRAREIVARLQKLRKATSPERYNGPVLFEGEAGAEVFAQFFAPAIVVSRSPVTDNPRAQGFLDQMSGLFGGGTLDDRIGGRVLPETVSLVDDPQLHSFEGQPLLGTYSVDDDGLPARAHTVVDGGVLKLVLASRTPIAGATQSTGNHRGLSSTPSNLLFTSTKSANNEELRRMLLDRAKARGYGYGIVVRRAGGSTSQFLQAAMSMMQGGAPAGNNMLEVYKIFPDGHEELVHGLQLPSMAAASFKDIVAVGDKPVVYNSMFLPGFSSLMMLGISGDPSALTTMPVVSYIVPSLLFEDVALKNATGPFPKAPVSAPPALSGQGGATQ